MSLEATGAAADWERARVCESGGSGSRLSVDQAPGQAHSSAKPLYSRDMSRPIRLAVVLTLNLLLVTALIIVGLTSRSLGVLAAGVDYLADAAAIAVSLLAIWISIRPPTANRPNGYPNATAIAALVNGGWLLILCAFVTAEATRRLITGTPHVDGLPVLVISGIAAAVMLVGAKILGGDPEDVDDDRAGHLNMRAVLLDTVGDAAAAVGVAVAGAIILATGGFFWLDPVIALVIAIVLGYHALKLLTDVVAEMRRPARP